MHVETLLIGRPKPLPWRDRVIRTSIGGRVETTERVPLGETGFKGDRVGDSRVHGGPHKAVCVYPVEHRPFWEQELGTALPPGAFGENLCLRGVLEDEAFVGDVLRLGSSLVQVAQPRGPCFKLAARWGRKELPALMATRGISGWYFRVLETGDVGVGDTLELVERRSEVSIAEVMRVTYRDRKDAEAIARVLAVPELAEAWRRQLRKLAKLADQPQLDLFGVD
jgi:MOSC domain-containing protein YiiM